MKTGYFPLKNLLLEVVDMLVKFNFFLWVLGLAEVVCPMEFDITVLGYQSSGLSWIVAFLRKSFVQSCSLSCSHDDVYANNVDLDKIKSNAVFLFQFI